ncbi:MAG TPA: MurT ligase domain-containing protein [Acetobacteraceae bacterium]|nr:MurT ligase domain-containing protein [Acetobacteraceae bacterium]
MTKYFARPVGRLLRHGLLTFGSGGTSLPGRVALALDPAFLARARAYPSRILVTGTNGKTSTVSMIAALLREQGKSVATNERGANLRQGLATALLDGPGEALVLEVDELTVPRVAAAVVPQVMVVTGLFRDQLDRYGEVARVRAALAEAAAAMPETILVLNGDDPLTASLEAKRRLIFRLSHPPLDVPADGMDCPRCGALLSYSARYYAQLGEYHCPSCGFAAPKADVAAEASRDAFVVDGRALKPLPESLHPYSALAGIAAVRALGLKAEPAEWPAPVAGRGTSATIAGRLVTVVLGKNPASVSWNLAHHPADTHLFLVNNRIADGRDVSWLWDITLAPVRWAAVAGERAAEMLIRLRYEQQVGEAASWPREADAFRAALAATPEGGRLLVVATYTALPAALALLRGSGAPHSEAAGAAASLPPRPKAVATARTARIALLFPDQLGTYADSGNAVVLQRRLEWRGIEAEIVRVGPGEKLPREADVILLGGGEDRGQRLALEALWPMRAELKAMMEDGVPGLLVCGGLQLYGESLPLEGADVPGLGLLPFVTRRGKPRLVGRIGVASPLVPEPLVGFENHGGHSALTAGGVPLGRVLWGNGNGREGTEQEGVILHRTVGTYVHGPVLARNPALAEVILGWVAERSGFPPLAPLDDRIEREAAANKA